MVAGGGHAGHDIEGYVHDEDSTGIIIVVGSSNERVMW